MTYCINGGGTTHSIPVTGEPRFKSTCCISPTLVSLSQAFYSKINSPDLVRKDRKLILFPSWQMDEAETPGKSVSKRARKHFCLTAKQARDITGMLERRPPVCGFSKASSTAEMKECPQERMAARSQDLADRTGERHWGPENYVQKTKPKLAVVLHYWTQHPPRHKTDLSFAVAFRPTFALRTLQYVTVATMTLRYILPDWRWPKRG